jgi:acyl-CoA thioester hydrolase
MPTTLSATVRVRTYELDSFGHVNNSVYLNYFEEARSEYLKQLGVSFDDFARVGVQLVIVESYVKYLSPARYGELLRIDGSVTEFKAATLTLGYEIFCEGDGRAIASGWTRGAFLDPATNRPVRAPEPFRSAFGNVGLQ